MTSFVLARYRLPLLIVITVVTVMFSCADEEKEIVVNEPVYPVVDPDTVKADPFRIPSMVSTGSIITV